MAMCNEPRPQLEQTIGTGRRNPTRRHQRTCILYARALVVKWALDGTCQSFENRPIDMQYGPIGYSGITHRLNKKASNMGTLEWLDNPSSREEYRTQMLCRGKRIRMACALGGQSNPNWSRS